mmetsp:Transcript_8471/g.25478  ORF Transcript_8471/g.25478 Transcript_8471/m.25478 type:complete len:186 (-) Transcript_8471:41-598(-)
MEKSYSSNYIDGDEPNESLNVAVECFRFDTTRFVATYVIFVSCACAVVYGLGFNMAEALSAGNVLHAVVTFIFFHWAKGSPDTHAQGDYDDLTVWEQLEGGASWSPTKRIFLVVPTLLLLWQLNAAGFAQRDLVVNVPVYCLLCVVPKLPVMHSVRLFGINRTPGFDGIDIDTPGNSPGNVKKRE